MVGGTEWTVFEKSESAFTDNDDGGMPLSLVWGAHACESKTKFHAFELFLCSLFFTEVISMAASDLLDIVNYIQR